VNVLGSLGFDCETAGEATALVGDVFRDLETPTPTPTPTAINPTNARIEPITYNVEIMSAGGISSNLQFHSQSTLNASWRLVVSPTSGYPETHQTHRNLVRTVP